MVSMCQTFRSFLINVRKKYYKNARLENVANSRTEVSFGIFENKPHLEETFIHIVMNNFTLVELLNHCSSYDCTIVHCKCIRQSCRRAYIDKSFVNTI